MGTGIGDRNMIIPDWRRWLLLIALLMLGTGYLASYAFFTARSKNFIVEERNRKAMAYGAEHPASLPAMWKFEHDGPGNGYLGGGWSNFQRRPGNWMMDKDAWIMLAVVPRDSDLMLTLYTVAFTTSALPRNRIEVSVNGQSLGAWERGGKDASMPIDVRVPGRLLHNGQCQVRIHVDHLASMYRPDTGTGSNDLEVLLKAVSLRTADGAAEPVASSSAAQAK